MTSTNWRCYLGTCWLVLLCSGIGWTQSARPIPDSLARYRQTPHDTTSINRLNRYAWDLAVASQFTRADSILKQTEQAARQINYPYGLEQAYYSWGMLNYLQDKHERALFYGRGFDPAAPTARTGLQSMDQRAKAMGGSLAIRSAPGQGTSLKLTVVV